MVMGAQALAPTLRMVMEIYVNSDYEKYEEIATAVPK
jgi:hypothetical protein